ncbi:MAG: outer membrane lipoprotein-sorting protein, partial [Blastocatellia bacterium]
MPHYKTISLLLLFALSYACGNNAASKDSTNADPTPAAAEPLPDAGAMIKRMITQDGCKDFTAEMRMTAEDENGKRDQVEFRIQRKYSENRTATFLTILSPREETGKALLAIERADQPTEAFSYLAGLRKLTRVNSDRQLGFRGAKVTVQEMLGMELNQYTPSAGERLNTDGESLIRIEFKGKEFLNLAFPRIIGFFREKDRSPAKFELYDLRDELQKSVKIEEVKLIQNRQTITRLAIEDLRQKLKVKVETRKIEYDRGIPK